MTWKQYMMEPVMYPHLQGLQQAGVHHGMMYDHEVQAMEHEYPGEALLGHGHVPDHLLFSLPPGRYYPGPVLYKIFDT